MKEVICKLCFPSGIDYGELIPNFCLVQTEVGKYALIDSNGHRDHEFFPFPNKPYPDPDPECIHENDSIANQADDWIGIVGNWAQNLKICPEDGYALVNSCIKAGWNRKDNGSVLFWLYDFAGKKLKQMELDNGQAKVGTQ